MKIVEVRPYALNVGGRNHCLVKVALDSGAVGWGEAGLSHKERAVGAMVDVLRPLFEGRDPRRRGALWQEAYRAGYFEGDRSLSAALSAVDIALHDALGRELGVPVYELLGGAHRERVPVFPTIGSLDPAEALEGAVRLADDGWSVIRLMCVNPSEDDGVFEPLESVYRTAALVRELRARIDPAVAIGVEFHHRLSVAEAIAFGEAVPRGALAFLEEPIRAESPAAYGALRGRIGIPLAVGEEFISKWQFAQFFDAGVIDYARVDVANAGGFTESMKIAAMAEARYVDVMPHNPLGTIGTAATAHFALAVPNLSWIEYRGLPGDTLFPDDPVVLTTTHRLEGQMLAVSDAPGLGVDVAEARLNETLEPQVMPRLVRRDGSYTNW